MLLFSALQGVSISQLLTFFHQQLSSSLSSLGLNLSIVKEIGVSRKDDSEGCRMRGHLRAASFFSLYFCARSGTGLILSPR